MKVYLHYNEVGDESLKMTIKLSLPKTWKNGPFSQLQNVLIDNYNKKHSHETEALVFEKYHLEKKDGTVMPNNGVVSEFCENTDDLFLKAGPPQSKVDLGLEEEKPVEDPKKSVPKGRILPPTEGQLRAQKEAEANAKLELETKNDEGSLVMCKNFGCQKKFKESQNHGKACLHHIKPPIFHETRKYWACCPDKIAWDWETFMAIPGCKASKHNDTREGKSFLGGTDVRKAKEESLPQRLNAPRKPTSGLEKLTALRKTLVSNGVKGTVFDDARDQIKDEITAADEKIGVKVWDKVHQRLIKRIENALE